MRIAIDARMILHDEMHGIARYVNELLICLTQLTSEHEYFVFVCPKSPLLLKKWPDHIKMIQVKARWISFREQWELPQVLKRENIELFHAPSFVAPIVCPTKLIMTIHDLNHLVLPQYYTPFHQFYYQTFVKSCIKRSSYILTVSNFSKHEIIRNLNIKADKIHVTYNGVSPHYKKIEDPSYLQFIKEIYELPDRYIFCLSNNKPHKNVHQLVRAYCFSDITVPLVLTCEPEPGLIQLAESHNKKHLLFFSKFICEEHLPAVYSMTDLFVYPSTYEGFGLPPLEALACGAKVVVARSSSLPEVVGYHATFLDPYDYHDIARALKSALNNKSGLRNTQNSAIHYTSRFTWENMAKETLEVYEKCFLDSRSVKLGVSN